MSDTARDYRNIRAALETQFDGLSSLGFTNRVFENQEVDLSTFDKGTAGIKWIRGTLLPAETSTLSLGANGTDYHQGIFQIDYFNEVGIGAFETDMDSIANTFKRGTVLTHSGTSVRILNVSLGVGRRDGAFFVRNIDVSYYAVTPARS